MKINDPERFARELRGDFSEIDAYLKADRIKMVLVFASILACILLAWLL